METQVKEKDTFDLINDALVSASRQLNALLATHSVSIQAAYLTAKEDKLSISLTVELTPSESMRDAIDVKAKINFIESRVKDESIQQVSKQEKLDI